MARSVQTLLPAAGLLLLGGCVQPIVESNDTTDGKTETGEGTSDTTGDGDGDPGDGDGGPGDGDGSEVGVCGDGIVDAGEECDDGNTVDTDDCVSCKLAVCGDGSVQDGVESCDDGVNDGSYEGCEADCTPGPHCGDAQLDGPEECDDGNLISTDGCFSNCLIARSCKDIDSFVSNAPTGVSTIDVDGPGPEAPFEVWCEQELDGGGWQLISVRHGDVDTLFEDNLCLAVDTDCSGTIPAAQISMTSPKLLLATLSGGYWLRLDGLEAPGGDGLMDVVTRVRLLSDTNSCVYPHFCNVIIDPSLMIAAHSANWTPRSLTVTSQYGRYGGLWYATGTQAENHVFSFNFTANLGCSDALAFSDNSDLSVGNVACDEPGALYFRY